VNRKLDKQLCEKYPKIFANRNGDMKTTAMCWGFECGDGWYNIIDVLCGNIQHKIDYENKKRTDAIKFNQMLEDCRHGDYRIFNEYYSFGDDAFRAKKMETILDEEPREVRDEYPQVVAVQVKEKFGGLRFYVEGGTSEIHNFIAMAESMSYRTCEECGSPGSVYRNGWHKTMCEVHAAMSGRDKEEETQDVL